MRFSRLVKGVKWILLSVFAVLCAGCATGENGEKLNAWDTMKKWEQSMDATEDRLQAKSYN